MIDHPPGYPPTPNLDKAYKVRAETEAIGQFVEWLQSEKKIFLAKDVTRTIPAEMSLSGKAYTITEIMPIGTSLHRLIAECIGVDYDAMNIEQAAVLKYVQENQ